MLVDQYAVVRRNDHAALTAHGGLAVQNGTFETDDNVLVCAVVLQMLTEIAPYGLDVGHGICGIARVRRDSTDTNVPCTVASGRKRFHFTGLPIFLRGNWISYFASFSFTKLSMPNR